MLKVGEIYTLAQILTDKSLPDNPFLTIHHDNIDIPIQDTHLTYDDYKNIKGILDTNWRFLRITFEHIPIFLYRKDNAFPYTEYFDIETIINNKLLYWITPKGFYMKP